MSVCIEDFHVQAGIIEKKYILKRSKHRYGEANHKLGQNRIIKKLYRKKAGRVARLIQFSSKF